MFRDKYFLILITLTCLLSSSSSSSSDDSVRSWNELRSEFQNVMFLFSSPVAISNLPITALGNSTLSVQCVRDSERYLSDLQQLNMWAVQMFDATGKFPSGVLNGNVHVSGDIDLCLNISQRISANWQIQGQFCQASIFAEPSHVAADPRIDKILDRVHSHRALQSRYDHDEIRFFPTFSKMTWTFCLPATCSHNDLELFLHHVVAPFNHTIGVEIKIRVGERDCAMKRDFFTALTSPQYYPLYALTAIIIGSIFCGIYDFYYNHECYMNTTIGTQLLYAFSIRRNWQLFTSLDNTDSDDIKCVNGIRFIFSMAIYFLHRSVFGLFQPFSNRTQVAELIEGPPSMIFRAFWSHVDTFVILSGLLTSYYAAKKLQAGMKLNIWSMYLKRFLKFAPIYYIMVILISFVDDFIQSPSMFRIVNHFIGQCRTGLWKSFLFISNIDGINDMCYPPAHQLLTDFQMYLVAPFLIAFLWKHYQHASKLIAGMLMALTLFKGGTMYYGRLGSVIYHGITLKEMLASANALYLNPLHRAPPYLCGIALGYYLQKWKKEYITHDQRKIGWCVAMICAYYSFFGLSEASFPGYQYNVIQETLFGVCQPLMWSFTICWTIFMCHSGYGGMLNTLLSWRGFELFSRIAYPFYMCQILIIFVRMAPVRVPVYLYLSDLIDLNELVLVTGCSMILTVVYMYPVSHLYTLINSGVGAKNKKISHREYVQHINYLKRK